MTLTNDVTKRCQQNSIIQSPRFHSKSSRPELFVENLSKHIIMKAGYKIRCIATTAAPRRRKKERKKKKIKKKETLNRGLEPLLSPSPGMHSVLDPVEPPRLDNDLNALIARYILSIKCVSTPITNPPQIFSR